MNRSSSAKTIRVFGFKVLVRTTAIAYMKKKLAEQQKVNILLVIKFWRAVVVVVGTKCRCPQRGHGRLIALCSVICFQLSKLTLPAHNSCMYLLVSAQVLPHEFLVSSCDFILQR